MIYTAISANSISSIQLRMFCTAGFFDFFHAPQGMNLVRYMSAMTNSPNSNHMFPIQMEKNVYNTVQILKLIHRRLLIFLIAIIIVLMEN